jgi:hypothetical protein
MELLYGLFWDITPCSPLQVNRRFGEHNASIFTVEENAKQEISVKTSGKPSRKPACHLLSRWYLDRLIRP